MNGLPLDLLQQANSDWLLIPDRSDVYPAKIVSNLAAQYYQELLTQIRQGRGARILLATPDPLDLIARFIAAVTAQCPVFLGNPVWSEAEWRQVLALVQPDLLWGTAAQRRHHPLADVVSSMPLPPTAIMVPTGGSSGQIRFAVHTWQSLVASVAGFCQYFSSECVNSCCVLPLYHVSGLMQLLRSLISGGQLALLPRSLDPYSRSVIHPADYFISLVPTQLQRFLEDAETRGWLSRFQAVLLGGAPAWPELLEVARRERIPVALTYGMTETAAQVATLKPGDFLKGIAGSGQMLPHTEITIQDDQGQVLPVGQVGQIKIRATSLCLGYYPLSGEAQSHFLTDDLGYFDPQGYLHIVGRSSTKIITGGENVFPTEVESSLYATGLVKEVYVLGMPDRHWGEAVTAVYVPAYPDLSIGNLQQALSTRLSKFKQPKHWIAVSELPRNAQGKINRQQIKAIVTQQITP